MIYMASTGIPAEKTAGQIQALIGKWASHVMCEYENGEVTGLAFQIKHKDKSIPFLLPIRWQPVLETMKQNKKTPRHLCNPEQARKVAWRQIYRWVEAQLALIETGIVDAKEVFMPYILLDIEKKTTLYTSLETKNFKAIGWEG